MPLYGQDEIDEMSAKLLESLVEILPEESEEEPSPGLGRTVLETALATYNEVASEPGE